MTLAVVGTAATSVMAWYVETVAWEVADYSLGMTSWVWLLIAVAVIWVIHLMTTAGMRIPVVSSLTSAATAVLWDASATIMVWPSGSVYGAGLGSDW